MWHGRLMRDLTYHGIVESSSFKLNANVSLPMFTFLTIGSHICHQKTRPEYFNQHCHFNIVCLGRTTAAIYAYS